MSEVLYKETYKPGLSVGFKYCIDTPSMLWFHKIRVWMTETYGEGYKFPKGWQNIHFSNDGSLKWGYFLEYQTYLIFFMGDEEFAWFKLRFGDRMPELETT